MKNQNSNEDLSSIAHAKEHRSTAKKWAETGYFNVKRIFLVLLAILAAGLIELLIILLLNR